MLPKPEKPSKKDKSSPEQLDLVKTIDDGSKIENKRRWVIFLLISTIGLSLAFSLYRWARSFTLPTSLPQVSVKLPDINLGSSYQILDANQISDIIDSTSWSLSLVSIKDAEVSFLSGINSSHLEYDFGKIIKELSALSVLPDSLVANSLPQGLNFSEKIITDDQFIEHQLLINLPQKHYLLITRSNSPDPAVFRKFLPQLIDSIYWRLQTTDPN